MPRSTLVGLAAAAILLSAGAASQSGSAVALQLPVLFAGRIHDAQGDAVGGANVAGYVDGALCGEAESIEDGSYGLPIPDRTDRPDVCLKTGASISITVDGEPAGSAKLGTPGRPIELDLVVGGSEGGGQPAITGASGALELAFNGSPLPGVNSVAALGETLTAAAEIRAVAEAQTGRDVLAIWLYDGVEWRMFIPDVVEQSFSVDLPAALYIVLG